MFKFRKQKVWEYYQTRVVHLFKSKARLFITWFETSPATNYITMDIGDRKTREMYVLTLQRVNGKSPSEVQSDNEEKIERLRGALTEIAELAWDVRDPEQARVRIAQISDIAGILDE